MAPFSHSAGAPPSALTIEGLGKGVAPLDGPWQFHLGDNPAWAAPGVDDATGHNGWEQLTAAGPWGTQGHASYNGYAWYRRQINITPAPGASPDVTLLSRPSTMSMNSTGTGFLSAIWAPSLPVWIGRVHTATKLWPWSSPQRRPRRARLQDSLMSTDDGTAGGFEGLPLVGSPKGDRYPRRCSQFPLASAQQFLFALTSLYGLASILSFIAWLRDRKQRLLFWMAAYTFMPVLEVLLNGLRLPLSTIWLTWIIQTAIAIREICQWFLLIYLLQLDAYPKLMRLVRIAAFFGVLTGFFDGGSGFGHPFRHIGGRGSDCRCRPYRLHPSPGIGSDIARTYAIVKRQRLDSARWLVAIFALFSGTWYSLQHRRSGVRFTHWTLGASMSSRYSLWGNSFNVQILLRTLLFLSIVYAVIRYSVANQRRQNSLEREFQNARELQQILVPETLPAIPGFTLTSAYRPAQEVGGDFFQIIPLEGAQQGSTLIVLGDVSGKGLQAAMTVSLIVGAVRTLAKFAPQPAQMLAEINQRLHGRLQGGFATCIACCLIQMEHVFSPVPAILRRSSTNVSWTYPEHSRWDLTRLPAITSFHCNCARATIFPFTPTACWKRAMLLWRALWLRAPGGVVRETAQCLASLTRSGGLRTRG